jgi:hypothetical protein
MKTLGPGLAALVFLSSLSACMHTPEPQDPENTEDDSTDSPDKKKNPDAISPEDTSGESALGDSPGHRSSGPMREHATIKDDDTGGGDSKACGGASISDLLSVVDQKSCEVPKATPDNETEKDVKDSLEVKATIDTPKVAPGGKANVTVTLHNKGKTDLPLDFVIDPEPRFDLELYTLKGSRAENPPGAEPALPDSVTSQAAPDKGISRVTLSPGGTASIVLPWSAVKYKWASADRAKGALPGSHYPRDVAGPLRRGKYAIKVIMPLVGVTDHDLATPRVPVEVH